MKRKEMLENIRSLLMHYNHASQAFWELIAVIGPWPRRRQAQDISQTNYMTGGINVLHGIAGTVLVFHASLMPRGLHF